MRTIIHATLLIASVACVVSAQCGANGSLIYNPFTKTLGCTGKVGAAGYKAAFTSATSLTVTASTHGQGATPWGGLWYWSLGTCSGCQALAQVCDGSDADHSPAGETSWCTARVQKQADLVAILTELSGIQGALASLDDNARLAGNTESAVHTRLKVYGGQQYLIAANTTSATLNPTFTLSSAPVAPVSVYGESRTIAPTGSTFTDSFAPYGAHVYQITEGTASGARAKHGAGVRFGAGVKR